MEKQHWQDWLMVVVGAWLVASPLLLPYFVPGTSFTGGYVAMNFYITGLIILALGIAEIMSYRLWEEVADIAVGLWLLASPWILGFDMNSPAKWNAIIVALVVIGSAGWAIADRGGPQGVR